MNEKRMMPALSAFHLKWIAAVTMLIDHIGAIFFPGESLFRIIGRISFPIFAFLIAEGFHYTHDIRKYLTRMLIFACISEIPFDLAFFEKPFDFQHQNVMFTFFLALVLLELVANVRNPFMEVAFFIGAMVLTYLIRTDYSYFGILLVYFYAVASSYRERWKKVFPTVLNLAVGGVQKWGTLTMIPLYFYSGKEGRKMKYFFYIFYPGHLLILFLIKEFII